MAKYIKVKSQLGISEIIMFPETIVHSYFSNLNPISAGFISFYVNHDNEMECQCHGESLSLGLVSNPEEDTRLAKIQFLK
jgi:hypothetical protein